MKIAIIGYAGSGKSSLARYIGNKYNIPVLYLDCVHWLSGWIERKREEEIKIVESFLNENSGWVIDGTYTRVTFVRRLKEADRIIFMNFNRFSCLYRAFKRFFQYRGKSRESITAGCDEKIDFEFVKWILYKGRGKKRKEIYREVLKEYESKVIVINNQKELNLYKNNQLFCD